MKGVGKKGDWRTPKTQGGGDEKILKSMPWRELEDGVPISGRSE